MALRVFEEFAEWSDSSAHAIKQADEESGPETREKLAMEFAEVLRKPPRKENADRPENRSQERFEDPDPSGEQAAEESRGQSAGQGNGEPAENERKDPEWREKEIERILKALSRMQS